MTDQAHILRKMFRFFFTRCFFLYFLIGVGFFLFVNFKQAETNLLNNRKRIEPEIKQSVDKGNPPDPETFKALSQYYKKLLHRFPNEALIWGNIGACYFYMGDNLKALQSYQQAIALSPTFYTYYWDLGMIYYHLGDFNNAAAYLQRSLQFLNHYDRLCDKTTQNLLRIRRPDALPTVLTLKQRAHRDKLEALMRLADVAFLQKDINRMNALVQEGLSSAPDFASFHYNAGLIHFFKKDGARAIDEFSRAIILDPLYVEAYYYRSQCFKKIGQNQLSQKDSQKAFELKTQGAQERHVWPQDVVLHFNSEWLMLRYQISPRQ